MSADHQLQEAGEERSTGNAIRWLSLLLGVVLLLHASGLSHRELHGEEGRRVVAAREMLRNHDAVVPTVWGVPYLNKPPLYPWLTAAVASLRGGVVDEISVRIPALLATFGIAAILLIAGYRVRSPRSGLMAAIFFLLSPLVIPKSTLGETDLVLTFGCTLYAFEMINTAASRRWISWILMICGMSIALLVKGPSALPFCGGVVVAVAMARGSVAVRDVNWWGPPLISLLIASIWVLLLFERVDDPAVVSGWFGEVSRSGSSSGWWAHRAKFIPGLLLGFLPATWILLGRAALPDRRSWFEDPNHKSALVALLIPTVILLCWPAVRPRYILPALPLATWLAARVIEAAIVDGFPSKRVELVIQIVTTSFRGLICAFGVAFLAFALLPGISWDQIEELLVPKASLMLAAALLLVGSLMPLRGFVAGSMQASTMRWGLLLLVGFACHVLVYLPARGDERPGQEVARAIEQLVPDGEILWHDVPANWNTLAQIDRPLTWWDAGAGPSAGDLVLKVSNDHAQLKAGWQRFNLPGGTVVILGRL